MSSPSINTVSEFELTAEDIGTLARTLHPEMFKDTKMYENVIEVIWCGVGVENPIHITVTNVLILSNVNSEEN